MSNNNSALIEKLNLKISKYYKKYYHDKLGLKDWKARIENRLNEEITFSENIFNEINQKLNFNFKDKKVLVVGCGTGGELIYLYNVKKADVCGIEPDLDALDICKMKSKLHNVSEDKFICAYSEELPFSECAFDFVYCYTVLEHVNDVEKSIDEMIRVTKKEGYIYINAPDYRQFTERHYKLHLPMFLPRFINKIILIILNRPTEFLYTLQLINKKQLYAIFKNRDVITTFYRKRAKFNWKLSIRSPFSLFSYFMSKFMKIDDMQEWLIQKK